MKLVGAHRFEVKKLIILLNLSNSFLLQGVSTVKRKIIVFLSCTILSMSIYASPIQHTKISSFNPAQIEQLTYAKGQLDTKENVFKVSAPRNDLSVIVAGVKMVPAMGLTSWAAFKPAGKHTMVMGDIVLTENQVNPVMSVALDNGLHVTALHNHFLWDTPRVMFMHIEGMGNETALATAVGKVFAAIKKTSSSKDDIPTADINPANTNLYPKKIEEILGKKGALKDGVYKITIGRTAKMDGHNIGNTMGVNTWAAFAGSDNQAVVDGDFAMHESELQNVLIALRHAGINIVAIHQHMVGEQPRIIFLHYWGVGSTKNLAEGLRAALDQTHNS